jgi:L-histidine N-alpha-methyltransferase
VTNPSAAAARAGERMLAEVSAGLAKAQKELPPKYFYDARGSLLFDEITRLPEYYLTRAERALLGAWAADLIAGLRPRTLIELGAGSAEKTRVILDAMRDAGVAEAYVPMDVSAAALERTAAALREEYPRLSVVPCVADISAEFSFPPHLPRPILYSFLGSTIGNFEPPAAARLLRQVRAAMEPRDRFLLGADLDKDPRRIEAAYNDARGVTAEFNRNVLRVLNRELGADFDPDAFEHRAFYDRGRRRVEMHLVSKCNQAVTVPGVGVVPFRAGESVRTEISCKYDRAAVEALFAAAGLRVEAWRADAGGDYALVVGAPAP